MRIRKTAGLWWSLDIVLAAVCLSTSAGPEFFQAQEKSGPPRGFHTFVWPKALTADNKLSVQGKVVVIKGLTTLIWVDLAPGARFAHPAELILISSSGTRVVRADWWPTLNGKDLFRNENQTEVDSPLRVNDK
jgi:hypothetical protein